jgi:hypothetical protein
MLSEDDPNLEAELKARMDECDAGYFYTMLEDEEGHLTFNFECNKCKKVAHLRERPFPHKWNCPMRKLYGR